MVKFEGTFYANKKKHINVNNFNIVMLLGKFFYIFSHGFKQILNKGLLIFYLGDQKLF